MLIAIFALLLLALFIRLAPALLAPLGAGVDQWYWRAYIEILRRDRRIPVAMPQFLLEEAQWYPPFFPWLMAHLPPAFFDRYSTQLSIFIDMLRMSLLVAATWFLSGSESAALLAGVAYAITPLLITYNIQLNPRGMGALFMDAMWLGVAALCLQGATVLLWLLVLVFAGLVLVTHKMAAQLLWFTALLGSCIAMDFRLTLLVPGSILAALILSNGFYRLTMRAHWDGLKFWYRNWSGNGVHPVLESPIYGEPGYESPGKFYRHGTRAWMRRLFFVIGFNPWMPSVLVIGALGWWEGHIFSVLETWAFAWLAITFIFALLTTIIPGLRCLGQGYLYGYNGSFPAALTLGLTWPALGQTWYWQLATLITVVACLAALAAYFRALRGSRTMKVDSDLDAAIQRLAVLPKGPVMCLPQHWHDLVAYRAQQPVLFGGHGFGYRLLEPIFPVLRLPVQEIISRYGIHYLLTFESYLPERFLKELPAGDVESFGDYRLYRFVK